MTNTSAKQQLARRENDVLDDVQSKPAIKKIDYFKQCPFFSFFIRTLFCLSRSACLLTRKNLARGSERKIMGGKCRFGIFLLSLLLIQSVHE